MKLKHLNVSLLMADFNEDDELDLAVMEFVESLDAAICSIHDKLDLLLGVDTHMAEQNDTLLAAFNTLDSAVSDLVNAEAAGATELAALVAEIKAIPPGTALTADQLAGLASSAATAAQAMTAAVTSAQTDTAPPAPVGTPPAAPPTPADPGTPAPADPGTPAPVDPGAGGASEVPPAAPADPGTPPPASDPAAPPAPGV